MNPQKPLKRHASLQSLSHDHHHGLVFCRNLKEGIKRNISPDRIDKYANWFWDTHLEPHFETEEIYLFPILGNDDELVKQAVKEHRDLKNLIKANPDNQNRFSMIKELLEKHIRFEERILFNKIEQIATIEQLQIVEKHHQDLTVDTWNDMFWK
ncbi:MAG: hemerythrin domain-containing protein [Ignavibacteria bacterium]|nr:hemerythrin domain-containing protein [Ignavibacteria bacterium]